MNIQHTSDNINLHMYTPRPAISSIQTWIPSSSTQLPSFVWAMDNPGLTVHGIHLVISTAELWSTCKKVSNYFRTTFSREPQMTHEINSYKFISIPSFQPAATAGNGICWRSKSMVFLIENSKLMTLRILHRLEGPMLRSLTFKPWPKITSQVDPSWSKVQSAQKLYFSWDLWRANIDTTSDSIFGYV